MAGNWDSAKCFVKNKPQDSVASLFNNKKKSGYQSQIIKFWQKGASIDNSIIEIRWPLSEMLFARYTREIVIVCVLIWQWRISFYLVKADIFLSFSLGTVSVAHWVKKSTYQLIKIKANP